MGEYGDTRPDSLPPKSISTGLLLVSVGAVLAAVDVVIDTIVAARLLTHNLDGSKFVELWAYTGVRAAVYLVAVPATLLLAARVRRGGNPARIWLIVLLCVYVIGAIPNFLVTEAQLLAAALGGGYGRPLELWTNYTALASMALDVLLALVALTSVVLLAVGAGWTKHSRPRD